MQVRAHLFIAFWSYVTDLYRSRAVQISMNISVIEEWIDNMDLPKGVGAHFAPVKDLLNWLQVRP